MDRTLAMLLAAGRTVIGAGLLVAPGHTARTWIGADSARPAVRVVVRALGARDLALGAGALLALRRGRRVRGWLEAGALADGVDALATLAAGSAIPQRGRWATVALAAGAAVTGATLARRVDGARSDEEPPSDADPAWVPREPARH